MKKAYLSWLALLLAVWPLYARTSGRVQLRLKQRTILHVGQTAVLRLPKGFVVEASAGEVLSLLKQTRQKGHTVCFYRADHAGQETILSDSPAEMAKLHCVSCATEHYFITVLPSPSR